MPRLPLLAALAGWLLATPAGMLAQQPDHTAHAAHASHAGSPGMTTRPTEPGQDAFAAIAEIVRILEADSTTDWSKVDIDALRRHLIAMNDVTLRASVSQTAVAGGARMVVTGQGTTVASIRSILRGHAPQLDALGPYRAVVTEIPLGARITVTASDTTDRRTEAKIRGLGLLGLLTLGEHHSAHHLAIARGAGATAHQH